MIWNVESHEQLRRREVLVGSESPIENAVTPRGMIG